MSCGREEEEVLYNEIMMTFIVDAGAQGLKAPFARMSGFKHIHEPYATLALPTLFLCNEIAHWHPTARTDDPPPLLLLRKRPPILKFSNIGNNILVFFVKWPPEGTTLNTLRNS